MFKKGKKERGQILLVLAIIALLMAVCLISVMMACEVGIVGMC
jgi:hypothetical protein